ncbi:MAG: hypothetical protein AB7U82_01130 [Blastocatellales bacterium]
MTEDQFNQMEQQGQVGYVEPEASTKQESLKPLTPDEYQAVLEPLRKPKAHVTAVPTFVPRSFAEAIQFLDDGTSQKILAYINGAWRAFGNFDLLSKFVDLIHWSSLVGCTSTGTGAAAAQGPILLLSTASGLAGSQQYVYEIEQHIKLLETGKLVTVEWQVADFQPSLGGGGELHFYMQESNSTPPTTGHHFGFYTSSDAIYASNADGTTQKTTTTGVNINTGEQRTRLKAVVNPGTDVKFYVNDVLKVTHTTNLPSAANYRLTVGVKTGNTTQRDLYLNRVLITKEY